MSGRTSSAAHVRTSVVRVVAVIVCLVAGASTAWGAPEKVPTLTHLNGTSVQIVSLSTFCLQPTNVAGQFYYDRRVQAPFGAIPAGFSFVITDVIVQPVCDSPINATDPFLVAIDILGTTCCRSITVATLGAVTKHEAFTGGVVIPEGATIQARNLPSSTRMTNVEILGYFVSGPGLPAGQPFPF